MQLEHEIKEFPLRPFLNTQTKLMWYEEPKMVFQSRTICTCSCRSFFSCTTVTIFSSSSFLLVSDLVSSSFVLWNSSFIVAISFSVSTLFKRGFILKYNFIQGQCLTFMNARMLYWMQQMDSLKSIGSISTVKKAPFEKPDLTEDTHLWLNILLNSSLLRYPLHRACVFVMSFPKQSSRISSKTPSKPALKNTCNWRTVISHLWAYILMQLVISHCVEKLEVYLSVSKFVLSMIYLNGRQQLLTRLLAINKLSFRNDTGIQEAVSDKMKENSLTAGIISAHRMLQEQLSPWRYRGRLSLTDTIISLK